jgi:oxygen-independent coproporphyrinogen-3 oxidase
MSTASCSFAEQSVPRYTSYPTAPHFTGAVTAGTYGSWLAALPRDASLSLYLHVPFCIELCHYCGCHTKAARRPEPVVAYADVLAAEIDLVAQRAGGRKVIHLHWGGGTPSILGPERLIEITERLRRAFSFAPDMEHAMELDPRRIDRPLVAALARMGVNRASLGVQEFSPHVQRAIGRVQPYGTVVEGMGLLREAGIANVNVDLMYGLPKQSVSDLQHSIRLANTLAPQRFALFGYAHVPWFKSNQRLINDGDLPDTRTRLAQADAARALFEELGYQSIGLDHFARPDDALAIAARSGRLHRNFQGYTTDTADALIGLGASAIGRLPQGFVQNAADVGGYARAITNGQLATVKGLAFSADDHLRARIIERLMCDFAVDLDAVADRRDFADELAALAPLQDEGFVDIAGHRIAMTDAGKPYVRLAAAAFDSYLKSGEARHSRAV